MWPLVLGGAALLAGAAALRGRREAHRLHITRVNVPIPALPSALDGFEIIHLSDLHLTGYGPYEQAWLRAVRSLSAPVAVITGDLAASRFGARSLVPMLMELSRERTVLAVLGNNDYDPAVNTGTLVRDLTRAGVRVLLNEAHAVRHRDHRLWFVGVDDPHTGRARLHQSLAAVPQHGRAAEEPVILLAHSPDIFLEAKAAGAALVLAGHTHGGQICLPGGVPVFSNSRLGRRYARGLISEDGTSLFVSRGIGTSGVPMRLFCPPEVAVIRLRTPDALASGEKPQAQTPRRHPRSASLACRMYPATSPAISEGRAIPFPGRMSLSRPG